MRYKEVKDNPGLVRDTKSGAILYTDSKRINRKKEINAMRKAQALTVTELQQKVETLQDDVSDIKQLLLKLVEKENG